MFYAGEEGIELVYDGTGESLYLTLTDDGALYDSELDEYWYRTDEITAPEPYFSANAIAVNATMDDGTFLAGGRCLQLCRAGRELRDGRRLLGAHHPRR